MKIPNKITVFRFFIHLPVLYGLITNKENWYWYLFGLYLLNVILDKVDGSLARHLKQETLVGRLLDSLVDKFVLHSLFVLFVIKMPEVFPVYVYLIILFRDLTVEITRQYTLFKKLNPKISPYGRFKSLFLFSSLILGFMFLLGINTLLYIKICLTVVVILAAISLFDYIYAIRHSLKKNF